jgi:hypothetical protein
LLLFAILFLLLSMTLGMFYFMVVVFKVYSLLEAFAAVFDWLFVSVCISESQMNFYMRRV